jgi:hypothetical protein
VDGYVRASNVGKRKGERFISPKVQREGIEAWAARRTKPPRSDLISLSGAAYGRVFPESWVTVQRIQRDRPIR